MQMVIKISDEDYKAIAKGYLPYGAIAYAIANGKPLPEHHGRLIDADEFQQILEDMTIRDNNKWFNWLHRACIRLGEMPTIIEADKCTYKETGCGSCKRQLDCPIEVEGSDSE